MKCFLAAVLICFYSVAATAATITLTPNVNFGTITYSSTYAGFGNVTVSADNAVSLGGSGGIVTQTGGGKGIIEFTKAVLDTVLNLKVANSGATYIVSNSCGSITVSNIQLQGGLLSLLGQLFLTGTLQIGVGATASINSISGTNCTISGTIVGALQYSTILGDLLPSTPANMNVTLNVGAQPVLLRHNTGASLNFGQICLNTTAQQTVTVANNGTVSGTNMPCTPTGTTSDKFTLTGPNGSSFSVQVPSTTTITNGTTTLTVSNFSSSCTDGCEIQDSGSSTINIGGRLTIPTTATIGSYAGTYLLSVTY